MTEENPDFEKYQSIAREIAGRTGNATLAKLVMGAYLDVAQTYNYFHGRGDSAVTSRVKEICSELDNLANEFNERTEEAKRKLNDLAHSTRE